MFDINEQSLPYLFDTFSRELSRLYNEAKNEKDIAREKECQIKIKLVTSLLSNLSKYRNIYFKQK